MKEICDHNSDQFVWLNKDNKVYVKCAGCDSVFSPQVNYDTSKFISLQKPTMHDLAEFTITKRNDGSYLYEWENKDKK